METLTFLGPAMSSPHLQPPLHCKAQRTREQQDVQPRMRNARVSNGRHQWKGMLMHSPLAYTHHTTLLRFLQMTLTTAVHITQSSHQISVSQLGTTSHFGDMKSSFAKDAGAVVHRTHDPSPYYHWPNSRLKSTQVQPVLPSECRRA